MRYRRTFVPGVSGSYMCKTQHDQSKQLLIWSFHVLCQTGLRCFTDSLTYKHVLFYQFVVWCCGCSFWTNLIEYMFFRQKTWKQNIVATFLAVTGEGWFTSPSWGMKVPHEGNLSVWPIHRPFIFLVQLISTCGRASFVDVYTVTYFEAIGKPYILSTGWGVPPPRWWPCATKSVMVRGTSPPGWGSLDRWRDWLCGAACGNAKMLRLSQ